jgi:hypothetical protein
MKQTFTQKNGKAFLILSIGLLLLGACKKKVAENSPPAEVSKTGNFSLLLGSTALQGSIYGEGFYTQGHEVTGVPTLELHLAGDNGQIDVMLLNPTINTDIKCGTSNSDNLFKVVEYSSGNTKSYASGDQGNVIVRLTKLDDKSAIGSVTGLVKNIDYPATADATITNGNFIINF